jgi:hypothetical protein
MMAKLLRHHGISVELKKKLTKYNKLKTNANTVNVIYDFGSLHQEQEFGRLYPKQTPGLANFERDIRNALAKDLYFDVDIKNAHPTLLNQVCIRKGWDHASLERYVNNRDEVLQLVIEHCNVSKTSAKNLMLCLMFGGT